MTDAEAELIESRVRRFLAQHEIPYETIVCRPDQADTAVFSEVFGIPFEASVNTILVASKKEPKSYAACLVLANTRLDVNRTVRKEMGVRKCSFASFEETEAVTGMLSGGVTPFDLPDEIPILIDARIVGEDVMWLGGGSRSLKVGVKADDLARLPNARVVEGLAG
jgi:prolyl-tRNA editing enzyme YbaK/EbsC (Cys-tRNA(Pro) deacylase)